MPPVGGFVALCVQGGMAPEVQKTNMFGDFSKVEFTPNCDTITGKLTIVFDTYRICHKGIRVRLVGHLELKTEESSTWTSIFKHRPTETILSAGGDLVHGRKRLNFILTIPPHESYPTPFVNSKGSLTYRLYALIKRDNSWEILANKLVNFKGYYNVLHMELNPFVESKEIRKQKVDVVYIFRVPSTVAIMGQCDGLQGILELQGVLESQVNATLTFFRNITYEGNIHTEVILSQNRQAEIHENKPIFKWTIAVPMMKRISYSNELIPMYSVRYYLKYEVFLDSESSIERPDAVVNGAVEVVIGTSRDPCGSKTNDCTNGATNQNNEAPQTGRRKSVMSLASMLSLPPAYSLLSSRSGSMMSLETLPPRYEELKKQ